MRFCAFALVSALLVAGRSSAFTTSVDRGSTTAGSTSRRTMALHATSLPPPSLPSVELPALEVSAYGPTPVRYSDFLRLVEADRVEKVTFSADGTQLLGVDVDGVRVAIEALPNDPDLLTQLTQHKVRDEEKHLGYLNLQRTILLTSHLPENS